MANIVCYDSDGKILDYYMQWDTGQKLIIKGADTSTAPSFQFLNSKITTAYVVESEISGNSVIVDVPDILLQYDVPIIVYICYDPGTTEYSVRIPIRPRSKPNDYVYVDPDTGSGSGGSVITGVTIVNNLTTNDPNAALSAAQGVVIQSKFNEIDENMVDFSELNSSVEAAINEAKDSGDFKGDKGEDGAPGRGIVSVIRTVGDGSAGSTDIYTITYTDETTSTFSVYNGANGIVTGGDGSETVITGANGATFTPYVDSAGNLSWTNDKGLPNPATVNLMGPAGNDGTDGKDGADGVSPVISVSEIDGGNRITISDINGSFSIDLLNGVDGKDGTDGETPIKGTHYWTDDDISEIKAYVDEVILGGEW